MNSAFGDVGDPPYHHCGRSCCASHRLPFRPHEAPRPAVTHNHLHSSMRLLRVGTIARFGTRQERATYSTRIFLSPDLAIHTAAHNATKSKIHLFGVQVVPTTAIAQYNIHILIKSSYEGSHYSTSLLNSKLIVKGWNSCSNYILIFFRCTVQLWLHWRPARIHVTQWSGVHRIIRLNTVM